MDHALLTVLLFIHALCMLRLEFCMAPARMQSSPTQRANYTAMP